MNHFDFDLLLPTLYFVWTLERMVFPCFGKLIVFIIKQTTEKTIDQKVKSHSPKKLA